MRFCQNKSIFLKIFDKYQPACLIWYSHDLLGLGVKFGCIFDPLPRVKYFGQITRLK